MNRKYYCVPGDTCGTMYSTVFPQVWGATNRRIVLRDNKTVRDTSPYIPKKESGMRHKQSPVWVGHQLALVLMRVVVACALAFVGLPAQASSELPLGEADAQQMEQLEPEDLDLEREPQEPPGWWYDPNVAQAPSVSEELQGPPVWWHIPQDGSELSSPDFTTIDIAVSLGGSQGLNAGAIPLNIKVTADGKTPEIVIQVVSEDLPDRAVYAGYEKIPDGAVQTLGGFQQAKFIGGVGPDNTAEVTFKYEALTVGWINFTVRVWSEDNLIYGPQNHSIYISPVAPTFTSMNAAVSLGGSQGLNAGAIPLNIKVTADGKTPEIVIQVVSEDLPDRAVYAGYEKVPGGAVQTLGGFQQAKFIGGVGPDNTAEVTFRYEALTVGWIDFTVKVWSEGNLIYGPQNHSVYISAVTPTFTNLDITASPRWGSQGLNAGAIPLNIKVTADGKTPEIVIQVASEDLPDRAVYAGYEKIPDGAVQTLGGFQQAKFIGGVGPDNTAEVTFKYEALTVGWISFTVKVWSEGNLLYGPEGHWVYIRETGPWVTTFPPIISNFGVASREHRQVTFNIDVSGNPDPQYELACSGDGAEATVENHSCLYHEPGEYIATLTTSNYVEGVKYSEVATTTVTVLDPSLYLPLVMCNHY